MLLKTHYIYISAAMLLFFLASCGNTGNEEPVARVYDNYLYPSDLSKVYNDVHTQRDSGYARSAFIRDWVRNSILLRKAEANLSAEDKDVTRLLDEYRTALLVHRYQEKFLQERLDTVFTEQELKAYFEENRKDFGLAKNIVQLQFVKISPESNEAGKIRKLLLEDDPAAKAKLAAICEKHAANFFLDDEAWLDLQEIRKELPISEFNHESYAQKKRLIEVKENNFLYLVRIKSFRTQNSVSSYELEKDKIKAILLRQKKMKLLREMEAGIMKEAEVKNDIQLYESR